MPATDDSSDGTPLEERGDGVAVTVGITQLTAFLSADDPDVREYAVRTLADAADDDPSKVREAVGPLIDRLEDDPPIRAHAVATLATVADDFPADVREAAPALTELLADEPAIRTDAADALASVADEEPTAVVPMAPVLADHVTDDADRVRIRVTDALASIASADPARVVDAVGSVAAATEDDSMDVRENATEILASVAAARPAAVADCAPRLLECLADEPPVRENALAAIRALAEEDPAAVASETITVADSLEDDRERVRADAAATITAVAAANPEPVHDAIEPLAARADDVAAVRRPVVETLATVARAAPHAVAPVVGTLVDRLEDPIDDLRANAAWALASIAADHPESVRPAVEPLADRALEDPASIRRDAVCTIAAVAHDDPSAVERVVPALAATLEDDDPTVRSDSARALAAVAADVPDVVEPFVPELIDRVDDEHEPVRHHVALALGGIALELESHASESDSKTETEPGDASTVPFAAGDDRADVRTLVDHLEADDEWLRGYAARALADVVRSRRADAHPAVRSLRARLAADEVEVRRAATRDLATVAHERPDDARDAVAALGARLGDDAEDPTVRNNAAIALSRLATTRPDAVSGALPGLLDALDDPDRTVRTTARRALEAVAPETDAPIGPIDAVCCEAATDGDEAVRIAAFEALGVRAPATAAGARTRIEAIAAGLEGSGPAVGVAALEALAAILAREGEDVDADESTAEGGLERSPTAIVLDVLAEDAEEDEGESESSALAHALADLARLESGPVDARASSLADRLAEAEGVERRALSRAVATIADGSDRRPAVTHLLEALESEAEDEDDPSDLAAAIAGLAAARPSDVAARRSAIVDLLEHDDEGVRGYATVALGLLEFTGRVRGTLANELDRVDERLREAAALVAGDRSIDRDDVRERIDELGAQLESDPWVAGTAALAIGTVLENATDGREYGFETLADGLDVECDAAAATTARVFATLADDDPTGLEPAIPALESALARRDGDVRANAAATLESYALGVESGGGREGEGDEADDTDSGRLADELSLDLEVLREGLTDPDARVRAASCRLVAAAGDTASLAAVRTLENDPIPDVSEAAVGAVDRLEAIDRRGARDGRSRRNEWKLPRANPAGTATVDVGTVQPTAGERWHYDAARATEVVSDGETLYAGCDSGLVALALEDAAVRWRIDGDDLGEVRTAPVIAECPDEGSAREGDRKQDRTRTGNRVLVGGDGLHAFDAASGDREWRYETDDEVRSPPVVVDGRAVVGSDGALHAVDVETGLVAWRRDLESGPIVALAAADGTVYASTEDGYVAGIGVADGGERWSRTVDAPVRTGPVVGERVYVGTDDAVCALETDDGNLAWRFVTGGPVETPLAVADEAVFAASTDGSVYAIDAAAGTERWRFDADATPVAPVSIGGAVCVGTDDGRICALESADGSARWTGDLDRPVRSIAVVNGHLCTTHDDAIVALGDGPAGSWTRRIGPFAGLFARDGAESGTPGRSE